MLLTIFQTIPDQRRPQGRMFDLPNLLFITVLAIMSGADSYRKIETFVTEHFVTLKERLCLNWKKAPAYCTIRYIIHGIDPNALESAFRTHAHTLTGLDPNSCIQVSLDGKTVKGSFDHFKDQKMIQVFSAFLTNSQIILGHEMIPDKKTNEIPVAQHLIRELKLEDCLLTLDALHCQKKRLSRPKKRTTPSLSR